jgi:hypothetical protein
MGDFIAFAAVDALLEAASSPGAEAARSIESTPSAPPSTQSA